MGRDDSHAPPPRPRMAVHVGAAGHREVPQADETALRDAAATLFRSLRNAAWQLHEADKAATPPLYSPDPPLLRCICSVAEGAASMLAEAAIAEGWSLTSVLPFPRQEFERDFTAPALERHRALIGRAEQIVELDGSRLRGGEPYAEVAEQVVEQSDLVLVIWDGLPPRGAGGTGDLVQRAMNAGRPLAILPTTGPATLSWTGACQDAASLLAQFLLPPADADASLRLYYERSGNRGRWAAAAVQWYERAVLLGMRVPRPLYTPADTPPPADPALQVYFGQADRLANAYAARFRLAGLLRYGLILPATAGAFFGQFGPVWVRTGGYMVQLAALGTMVMLTVSGGWERSQRLFVAYRALAEYLRNSAALAPLRAMAKVPGEAAHQARAVNWPEWYGRAVVRQIGLRPGFISTGESTAAASVLRSEVAGQLAFLTGRAARFSAMARRLKRIGVSLSLCGIILGAVRLVVLLAHGTDRYTLLVNELGLVLPSLAPVFLGLLGFGEYGRLAARYSALAEELARQLAALERAEPKRAAVLRIGRRITDAMLAESADWQLLIKARILVAY